MSMLFEGFVDQLLAEFLFISTRKRGFAAAVSFPLGVGESRSHA
jgi:hypothetical protein